MSFGKPAKKFDIVEVTESPYDNGCKIGERFVVLDVLNGDDTVISMKPDGSRVSLCYPEDYKVVSSVEEFNRKWKEEHLRKM